MDRATVCNDCGIPLVENDALGTPETQRAVASWHANETRAAAKTRDEASSGSIDIVTGWVLIGLSIVLLAGSYAVAASMGGGRYFIAVGPFVYGIFRLSRGWDAQRAQKRRPEA